MDNKLLTQSDIDSLVSNLSAQPAAAGAEKPAPSPASAPPPATPKKEEAAAAAGGVVPAAGADSPTKYQMKKASLRHPEQVEDADADSKAIATLTTQNNKLQERITRLEVKIQKLEQMEKVRSGVIAPISPQDFQGLDKKVEQLTEALQDINLKLQSTLGYDIYHQFTCEKCGAKENVSSVYRCTSCGHQTWLGWKSR